MSEEAIDTAPPRGGAPVRGAGAVKTIGVLGILAGILLIVVGIVAWAAVSAELRAEKITVPDDAVAFAGQQVSGPLTAYVQAETIQKHAMEASGGKTYAELSSDDPARATVMNASFLRASLFTSVVSFGVAAFAIGVGILAILFGFAFLKVAGAIRASRVAAP
ncbi:LigA [Microbacterium mangrovi]|uniref:LigA n=1 Tax=Microbacterium mangrovi TaxID=1348253 RepID=A0A0B2A558_9MICO|nr:hypothetical protein [Microbacterium mangrovi]KHK96899.1 LigA [Microbacterium mangrovi]